MGHIQQNCMHAAGVEKEPRKQKQETREPAIVKAISQASINDAGVENNDTAVIQFYAPHKVRVENPEWQ